MTDLRQTRDSGSEHTKAALLFTAILTIAANAAGLVVAGAILGFDYLLNGEPRERARRAEERARRRRDRYEEALAWLEADRVDRARTRAMIREWFKADPATRGDKPSSGETLGRVAARTWYWLLVGAVRFRRGWRDGQAEARRRRSQGVKDWWRVNRGHHENPSDTAPAVDVDQQPAAETPPPAPPHRPGPASDDIVDAEIVDDGNEPQQAGREIVFVGRDEPNPDLGVSEYADRIEALRTEVEKTRTRKVDDPSPPRSALR